jgi:hypothetical protein
MSHEINKIPKGFVAMNPLTDTYHIGEVSANQVMTTGQALLILCDTLAEATAHAFTSYDVVTGAYTPRPLEWLVIDTLAEAQAVGSVIDGFPDVEVAPPVPHGDNWLVPYSDYFFNFLEDSPEKTALGLALAPYLVGAKTTAEILAD